ncbi:MAG TPA: hypothetical protein VFX59_28410 [Polyangiales bacterium]|nr:hypothetical protein [Polyangiales bacterium]
MVDQNNGTNNDDWRQASEQVRDRAVEQRRRSERLADQLSRESLQQAQRAVEGLLSIPTAIALGVASTTLYAASIFERGFETVNVTVEALRSGIEQSTRELQRAADEPRLRGESRPS